MFAWINRRMFQNLLMCFLPPWQLYTWPWSVTHWLTDCHFRISTQSVTFETWDPSDIWSTWCLDKKTKRQKVKKDKKDKDQNENFILWRQGSFALMQCFLTVTKMYMSKFSFPLLDDGWCRYCICLNLKCMFENVKKCVFKCSEMYCQTKTKCTF